jgi:hypothetical protein
MMKDAPPVKGQERLNQGFKRSAPQDRSACGKLGSQIYCPRRGVMVE